MRDKAKANGEAPTKSMKPPNIPVVKQRKETYEEYLERTRDEELEISDDRT